jgi:hypothetical protein
VRVITLLLLSLSFSFHVTVLIGAQPTPVLLCPEIQREFITPVVVRGHETFSWLRLLCSVHQPVIELTSIENPLQHALEISCLF